MEEHILMEKKLLGVMVLVHFDVSFIIIYSKNPKLNSPVIERAGDDNKIIIKNINLLLDKLNIYSQ